MPIINEHTMRTHKEDAHCKCGRKKRIHNENDDDKLLMRTHSLDCIQSGRTNIHCFAFKDETVYKALISLTFLRGKQLLEGGPVTTSAKNNIQMKRWLLSYIQILNANGKNHICYKKKFPNKIITIYNLRKYL